MDPFLLCGLSSSKFLKGSRTSYTSQVPKLIEDLQLLLSTEKGTLWGRPDYGTDIQKYLFEPVTETTGELIRQEVINAIRRSYPNLNLVKVDVTFIQDGINLNIYYSVNQNNLNQLLDFDILRERRS